MAERPKIYYNQAKPEFRVEYNWWGDHINDEQRYLHVQAVVEGILEKQSYRNDRNLQYAKLYHNMEILGFDPGMYARVAQRDSYLTNRVTLNVIKSCIDTAASKIGKSKPRPYFLTDEGDWSMQEKGKNLTRYMDGWFYHNDAYAKGRTIFVDGSAFGTGAMKIIKNEQKAEVNCERTFINEIIVDEAEGIYGEPRQMHQRKAVFREVLASLYPDNKEKIYRATSCLRSDYRSDYFADMIYVTESWHLPSGEGAGDGRHTISIDTATLKDDEYEKQYFPFAFYRWNQSLLGFYGTGLAEELIGIQLEINKILRNIQLAQHLMAVPQVWLENTSQIISGQVNNEIGGIKRYLGKPPIFQVPPAMSPEIYNHLENLNRKAYEITGISQMSAQAKKPSGVTAAVALQTLSDMESERFMVTSQRYEEFYMDMTAKVIDMTRDLFAENKGLKMKAPGQDFMEMIEWRDVDLDEDQYVLRCYPTNLLPTQPAAKLQTVQELAQAGFIEREEAISMLDYPDVKAVTSRITAPTDDILKTIDFMLRKGKYISPEPYMNLDKAKAMTQSMYNVAKIKNCPEDKLELLRRYMDDCQAMIDQAAELLQQQQAQAQVQAAMQQMGPGAGAPPADASMTPIAQPAVQPTSELLPVV